MQLMKYEIAAGAIAKQQLKADNPSVNLNKLSKKDQEILKDITSWVHYDLYTRVMPKFYRNQQNA